MFLTAHQPVYLPWLGLFHKIAVADEFCFFDDVQYQPKDFNNRNRIKMPDGSAAWLTVPVLRAGYLDRSYLDIEIDERQPWRRKHWRSIELSYKKAPFFAEYAEPLRELYETPFTHLAEFNLAQLRVLLALFGIDVPVVRMSEQAFEGAKSDLVLDMCAQMGAETYLFGAQGRDYADVDAFLAADVVPLFQEYRHPVYPQLHGEFVSHLSAIDLLFMAGPESLEVLMSGNDSRADLDGLAARVRAGQARP